MEEPGGDWGLETCQDLEPDPERQDPRGAPSQAGQLDLDRGEGNTPQWDKHLLFTQNLKATSGSKPFSASIEAADACETGRDESRANQEAAPESGGGVPSLVISAAAGQVSRDGGAGWELMFPVLNIPGLRRSAPTPSVPKVPSLLRRSRPLSSPCSSPLFFV